MLLKGYLQNNLVGRLIEFRSIEIVPTEFPQRLKESL
jgi:hypothetical protein